MHSQVPPSAKSRLEGTQNHSWKQSRGHRGDPTACPVCNHSASSATSQSSVRSCRQHRPRKRLHPCPRSAGRSSRALWTMIRSLCLPPTGSAPACWLACRWPCGIPNLRRQQALHLHQGAEAMPLLWPSVSELQPSRPRRPEPPWLPRSQGRSAVELERPLRQRGCSRRASCGAPRSQCCTSEAAAAPPHPPPRLRRRCS
mmetsp:Transcript_41554/g.120311  ORF Transcript_41554/g.120311 Transcript_41554/m.120311 type:complete len:200 (+) Transcript_41554:501-1100(+)